MMFARVFPGIAFLSMSIGIAAAQTPNSDPLYRKLISLERMAIGAFASRSSRELLDIHSEITADVADDAAGQRLPSIAACWKAYTQLSVTVLFHASIISPELNKAEENSPAHNTQWADRTWSEYRDSVAECERRLGIEPPPGRPKLPSSSLKPLLPILPK